MKVAMVGTELAPLDPKVGALEKLCSGWADGLESIGYKVVRYSRSSKNSVSSSDENIRYFKHPNQLDESLKFEKIDVAIFNNRPLWATNFSKRINIFHNYPDAWSIDSEESRLARVLGQSTNLAVSTALANYVNLQYAAAETKVINPHLDNCFLNYHAPIHKNPPSKLRLLFPNRTLEKKGLRWLFDTIDAHLESKVTLTVVRNISPWTSETKEHQDLLHLAKSKKYVKLVERTSNHDELIKLYLGHDLVLTTSIKNEGLGLIPLEAQALGIPVVASNLGGLSESVYPPNITVEAGAQRQLAEAILRSSEINRSQLQDIAKTVKNQFSFAASTNKLSKIINESFNSDSFG